MINCNEATRRLWEYLDGTIAAADRALIEEHLERCRRCCGEREFAEALRDFLAAHAHDGVPDEVARRLNQTLEELGR
jgi:mycothiol system anti-sigma-R factor